MESVLSVGIDVGTTTTQVVFSRLTIENTSGFFSVPKVSIVDKTVVYVSEPHLTPFLSETVMDAEGVKAIVAHEYASANVRPAEVQAGAVIVTGESARKENAEALVRTLAGLAGEFVVSAAGPDMESVIAGKGSGAATYSKTHRLRVLNLDIGGGTTNAALFDNGRTVSTGCLDVGGRLVRTNTDGRVLAFSPAAKRIADWHNIPLSTGMQDLPALRALTRAMASVIAQQAGVLSRTPLYDALKTPHSGTLDIGAVPDALCFSGGVADAVYGRFSSGDPFRFGDIGLLLGQAVSENADLRRLPFLTGEATIRATVIGAGSYTTTVSGSTIAVEARLLPLRDLPVYVCTEREQESLFQGNAQGLIAAYKQVPALNGSQLAIALRGVADPAYPAIRRMAKALSELAEQCLPAEAPFIIVLEADMAKVLGQTLRRLTARPVLSIDGIAVQEQDRLDIGRPVLGNLVVPVVIKTLLFGN